MTLPFFFPAINVYLTNVTTPQEGKLQKFQYMAFADGFCEGGCLMY